MKRIPPIRTGFLFVIALAVVAIAVVIQPSVKEPALNEMPVVPAGSSVMNPVESILYLEDQVRKNPDHTGYQLSLAQTYMQYGVQSRQEPTYIPKAEKLLKDLQAAAPDLFEAKALRASLYNTLHEFEKARDLTLSLIKENGDVSYVYGILIDALVELGEYEAAIMYCDQMIGIKPGLASYARASYLRELHGDTEGAIEAMKLAADAGRFGSDERSWALYQLGQLYLGENNLQAATQLFSGILEEKPGYAFAIGGLGHVQLIEGNYQKAIELLEMAYGIVPGDEFLEGLVEAYEVVGEDEKKYEALDLIEQGYLEADKMGENVRMERADFMADTNQNLKRALRLAKKEYERRPDHLHALETYAWTLHKLGRSDEGVEFIERAMRLGTGDAMVYYRAAEIYRAVDNQEMAKTYLRKALDANLHIESPSAAIEAQKDFDEFSTI